jgi:ACS family glucarate transporter-like MFS transporter
MGGSSIRFPPAAMHGNLRRGGETRSGSVDQSIIAVAPHGQGSLDHDSRLHPPPGARYKSSMRPLQAVQAAAPAVVPTRVRHGVLAFTLALAAVAYLDRVCIATAAPAMKGDLGLTDAQMGYVFSAFTFAYALFEVPSGWLADRFGARLMLTRIVIWWSAMTAATGLVGSFFSLFAVRFLFGMGEAGTFPSIARAYGRWLPARERGRAFGLALMTAALGGAFTQPLVVSLLRVVHWRHTFPLFGAVGVVWALAWYWWFRDDPHQHAAVNAAELDLLEREGALLSGRAPATAPHRNPTPVLSAAEAGSGRAEPTGRGPASVPWGDLLRSRNLLVLCVMYGSAIYGWYFYITWLPTYLQRARGFDLQHAGWLAALPLLSIAGGVFAGGWVSDVLVRRWGLRAGRRAPGLVGLPLAALAVGGAIVTATPLIAAVLLAAAAGLAALGVSPAWAVCLEIGRRHAGVVSGAMNTFGNFGGALSPVVVGLSLQRWESWNLPLLTVAGFYLVAAACWLGVDPAEPIESADRR